MKDPKRFERMSYITLRPVQHISKQHMCVITLATGIAETNVGLTYCAAELVNNNCGFIEDACGESPAASLLWGSTLLEIHIVRSLFAHYS